MGWKGGVRKENGVAMLYCYPSCRGATGGGAGGARPLLNFILWSLKRGATHFTPGLRPCIISTFLFIINISAPPLNISQLRPCPHVYGTVYNMYIFTHIYLCTYIQGLQKKKSFLIIGIFASKKSKYVRNGNNLELSCLLF